MHSAASAGAVCAPRENAHSRALRKGIVTRDATCSYGTVWHTLGQDREEERLLPLKVLHMVSNASAHARKHASTSAPSYASTYTHSGARTCTLTHTRTHTCTHRHRHRHTQTHRHAHAHAPYDTHTRTRTQAPTQTATRTDARLSTFRIASSSASSAIRSGASCNATHSAMCA